MRSIHLDFHTMPGIYDVGRDFSGEKFAGVLKKAGVEYITVFARCNLGFAYYPTEIGIVHPGLNGGTDLLGEMVSACHGEGIKIAAYFNAGLDHEHALRHRDWCKMNKDGQVAEINRMGHYFRRMCLNTPYSAHLLGMVEEVMDKYPVDGIFLDCFTLSPCYGAECVEGMGKAGVDASDEAEGWNFCLKITEGFIEEVSRKVKKKNRAANLYFNGLPYRKQPTHIELEVLPTGGWGYDALHWQIRYARTLKKPYFTMTGRFHKSWGDFGGLRPEHSLLFDLYNSIANGGTCSVGDHMHPRGELDKAVYGMVGRVYSEVEKIREFAEDAKPETDMAIIEPNLTKLPGFIIDQSPVTGASRMLMELKCQFDILDGADGFSGYKAVILPDNVTVDGKMKKNLKSHLDGGGIIISSAFSGLSEDRMNFALEEYKIHFDGEEDNNPVFFKAGKDVSEGLPDMLITVYRQGAKIRPMKGTKSLCRLYKPYFNHASWDMLHENLYTPPEKDTGRPALVRCGNIFHFSFPVFSGYFHDAAPAYRTLVKNCLDSAYEKPLLRHLGLPSFCQATVTRKENKRMVHLLSYLPELKGEKMQIIEEPILIKDAAIGLRNGGRKVKKTYLPLSAGELEFSTEDDYTWVKLDEISGYELVVFEF